VGGVGRKLLRFRLGQLLGRPPGPDVPEAETFRPLSQMEPLSIIVPTYNSGASLENLLESVEANGRLDSEIIVVDNYSEDRTSAVAERHACTLIVHRSGRSGARNLGARAATTRRLLFLDADMVVTPGVLNAVLEALNEFPAVVVREVVKPAPGYWGAARAFERESYFQSNIFEAARGFDKQTFLKLGGYNSQMDGIEDLDLHARILESNTRLGWVTQPLVHDESGVSFGRYLARRVGYGRVDGLFAREHPERWRELSSPVVRLKWVLANAKRSPRARTWELLPGIVVQRAIEAGLRSISSRDGRLREREFDGVFPAR
jgi:glycosyltransferase involved in cell wall biosynthesis